MKCFLILLVIALGHVVSPATSSEEKIDNVIYGGVEVAKGRYPYIAALLINGTQFCGATLVHPNWVLSASHCVTIISADVITVELGRHNLSDPTETYETRSVDFYIRHPRFSVFGLKNDQALLHLNESSSHDTVTVDSRPPEGTEVVTMGWGKTSRGDNDTEVLLEIALDIMSQSQCMNDFFNIIYPITNTVSCDMICAAREGNAICAGDSGSALILRSRDGPTYDVQVGTTSKGLLCSPGSPMIFAEIDTDFIADTIERYDGYSTKECSDRTIDIRLIGNGHCDPDFYTEGCDYDGGDCLRLIPDPVYTFLGVTPKPLMYIYMLAISVLIGIEFVLFILFWG